jgi:23S rRNA (uridine2552-2'-O)-methyltransferase
MSNIKRKDLQIRVKTAKGRRTSSTAWLQRHINDPYVIMAKEQAYRSRAAYKLLEIHEKFAIFKQAAVVVDLGAAPGSWSQVVKKIGSVQKVVAIDLQEIKPIKGVQIIHGDFLDEGCQKGLEDLLAGQKAEVIMSDMAANSCGDRNTDHLRLMNLVEAALTFSYQNLNINGSLIAKMLRGECESALIASLNKIFKTVRLFKPKASYQDSSEIYLVAIGFKGGEGL